MQSLKEVSFSPVYLGEGLVKWPYLSVNPSITTVYYRIMKDNGRELRPKHNSFTLPEHNRHDGFLSRKAYKRIRRSVDWFLYSVDPQIMSTGEGRKKVTFITLTLPSSQVKEITDNEPIFYHSDKLIKEKCLNQLFIEGRKKWGLNRKIWKAEKQKNGSLHFHILADCYIDYKELRTVWNRIINKLGYVDRYKQQFENMTFAEYLQFRSKEKRNNELPNDFKKRIKKVYDEQKAQNWLNPNSTDIHSLYKSKDGKPIKNVGAYIAKYTAKTSISEERLQQIKDNCKIGVSLSLDEKLLKVDGRIWYCSEEISKYKNIQIELDGQEYSEETETLFNFHEKEVFVSERSASLLMNIEQIRRKGYMYIISVFDDFVNDIRNLFTPPQLQLDFLT